MQKINDKGGDMMEKSIAKCGIGACPEVFFDKERPRKKQVKIIDEFGGEVFMSKEQYENIGRQPLKY